MTTKPEHYYGFRLWTNCGIQVVYVSQSINQVREALLRSLVQYADIVEQVLAGHVHATNLDDAIPAFEDGNLIDDKLPSVERHPVMAHFVHPQKPFLHITRLLK